MRWKRLVKLSGYLEKTCRGYGAILPIPNSLQDIVGRSHLCRDLDTSDPATAEARLYPALLGIHTELHASLGHGWDPAETGDLGLCLEEWMADADRLEILKPETRSAYRGAVKSFAAWCIADLAFLMPGQISSRTAARYVKFLQTRGASRSRIEIKVCAMSGLWEWMRRHGRTPERWANPWKRQTPSRGNGGKSRKVGKGGPSEDPMVFPASKAQSARLPEGRSRPSLRAPWRPLMPVDPQRWRGSSW